MFYSTLLLAATALTGLVGAQNYSTSGNISITPNSVDYNTRLAWCRAQTNSCPQICGGQASPNTCNAVSNSPLQEAIHGSTLKKKQTTAHPANDPLSRTT